MARYHNLRVYHLALAQISDVAPITPRFADLGNQMRRAAVSVVSNLAEGAGRGSDPDFIRFVRIARGSNDELAAQLAITKALGQNVDALIQRNNDIGRMLSGLIRSLSTA